MKLRVGVSAMGAVAAVGAVLALLSGSAGAVHEVVIEYTELFGDPGEVIEVATEEVEPFLQGESCAIEIEVENNESVHPGTELVIRSGGDSVTVADVESAPGLVTFEEGELVFGESVIVEVRLGEDGVVSSGATVDFVCDLEPPSSTTTATVAPSSTAAPTSTTPPPTTTSTAVSPAQAAAVVQGQPDYTG